MLKSLWLVSWYPSVQSSQNGDFIQRHARAVAAFAKVHVLYVVAVDKNKINQKAERCFSQNGNLSEEIILYKKRANNFLDKGLSFFRYLFLYKKYIRQYIAQQGLPDIVHVHVTLRAGLLALWIKRKYKIPYVLTEHWTIFTNERKDNFKTRNFLFRRLAKKVIKNASALLPVSNALGKNIQQAVINRPFTKVPNVVDTNYFFYTEKQMERPFTFVHVSGMKEIKNPKGIINAFANLSKDFPNAVLKMIGDAPEEIIEFAKKMMPGSRQIIFTGAVDYRTVAEEMRHADAFVLFSHSETQSCVTIESLCCGLPVIASNLPCISEMITPQNGILVPSGNDEALTNAMRLLCEKQEMYNRDEIALNAQSLFNYKTVGKQIICVYNSILEQGYK